MPRKCARKRALEVLERGGSDRRRGRGVALLVAAAELFGCMRAELTASPSDTARLAGQIEEVLGITRLALAREVLRSPDLLTVSPAAAVDAQLAMLTALAPLRSASLWTLDDAEQIQCVRHIGEGNPSRGAKQLAQRMLAGESDRAELRGACCSGCRWAAGDSRSRRSSAPQDRERARICHAFLVEGVPMLGAILERDALLAANAASERALVESSERKLTRLGFDLHDGPIQDVAVLAEDLRLFPDQLEMPSSGSRSSQAGARPARRSRCPTRDAGRRSAPHIQ